MVAGTAALAGCGEGSNSAGEGPSAPAVARKKRTLKMVTTWPKGLPGLGAAAERLAKRVSDMTDGNLTIKVYAAGEIVPAFESFDAVSGGTADMYHGAEYYWQGKSKGFNFFTAVPFGLTANENNAWFYHGGGLPLWEELSAKFNIRAMPAGNTGVQSGGWFRKEINTLDDLKSLKIRMPGLGGEVMRRLGAAAEALPGPEIYQALQQNRIEAAEWVGPWNDQALGFHQVADPIYYYVPGFHEPGATLALGVNLDVWQSLSDSERAIIQNACMAEDSYDLAEFNYHNASALDNLVNQHGVQLRRFSDEIITEMKRVSEEVIEEAAQEDELTGRIYESFLAARKNGMAWGVGSDEAYMNARRTAFKPLEQ